MYKLHIITIKPDNCEVFVIDGEYVRTNHDVEFALGGHHYRYEFIPENEIWIEVVKSAYNSISYNLAHEIVERLLMKNEGKTYEEAHQIASDVERSLRIFDGLEKLDIIQDS